MKKKSEKHIAGASRVFYSDGMMKRCTMQKPNKKKPKKKRKKEEENERIRRYEHDPCSAVFCNKQRCNCKMIIGARGPESREGNEVE